MTDIVLFNSGKNPISGNMPDGKPYKLMPQKALCFPASEAHKLKKLYRADLIDEADARAQFSPAAVMAEANREGKINVEPRHVPSMFEAPEKIKILTSDDKVQVAQEMKEVFKKLRAKGMTEEEIHALVSSANLGATIEMENEEAAANPPAPQASEIDETTMLTPNAGSGPGFVPVVVPDNSAVQAGVEEPKKGFIKSVLDRL
jgi:hypothetical protein